MTRAEKELLHEPVLRDRASYHEDVGPVLWWRFPVVEAPYCGSPLDDDFPDYVTHWTVIQVPQDPTTRT